MKKKAVVEINNIICIADTHCGDQLALCPERIKLAHGGVYHASKFQMAVLKVWNYFWDEWVPMVTRGDPYAVVLNGDAIEGRHHNATHQISQDKSDQQNIAYEILSPIVDKCDGRFYMISGTEVHVGSAAEDEEKLAELLGAIPNEHGRRCRYEMFMSIGGKKYCLIHFSHHIGVTSSMAYETTALTKEFTEFCADSAKWRKPVPDIVVRSHRHRHAEVRVATANTYGIIFVTSGWQLKTPFLFRVPGGRVTTPTIGGSLIRQGDEEFFTRHLTVETKRSKTEVL